MKRVVCLLIILCVGLTACRKIKNLATITAHIPYDYDLTVPDYIDTFDVPVGPGLDIALPPIAVQTNSAENLAKYHTSGSKIVDVKLSTLGIRIIQPPGTNFNFISSMDAYLSAPGLPEIQVASINGIPKGVDSISLACSDADLKNYFLADMINIRLLGHFNNVPPPNTTFRIHSVFTLRANPLY
ncbi:MAG: hypothetical protein JSS82_10195 [Bacteroidetes bacterium]|nr:hypothetical protein [Bacteroidota bacterium]